MWPPRGAQQWQQHEQQHHPQAEEGARLEAEDGRLLAPAAQLRRHELAQLSARQRAARGRHGRRRERGWRRGAPLREQAAPRAHHLRAGVEVQVRGERDERQQAAAEQHRCQPQRPQPPLLLAWRAVAHPARPGVAAAERREARRRWRAAPAAALPRGGGPVSAPDGLGAVVAAAAHAPARGVVVGLGLARGGAEALGGEEVHEQQRRGVRERGARGHHPAERHRRGDVLAPAEQPAQQDGGGGRERECQGAAALVRRAAVVRVRVVLAELAVEQQQQQQQQPRQRLGPTALERLVHVQRRGEEQALEQREQPRRREPLRLSRGEEPPPQREQRRLQQRAHRRARRRTRRRGERLRCGGGAALAIAVGVRSGGDGRLGGRGGAEVLEQRQHVRAREVGRGELPRHARARREALSGKLPARRGSGGEVGAGRGQQEGVRRGGGEADLQRDIGRDRGEIGER